jgi:hypothetical protein
MEGGFINYTSAVTIFDSSKVKVSIFGMEEYFPLNLLSLL